MCPVISPKVWAEAGIAATARRSNGTTRQHEFISPSKLEATPLSGYEYTKRISTEAKLYGNSESQVDFKKHALTLCGDDGPAAFRGRAGGKFALSPSKIEDHRSSHGRGARPRIPGAGARVHRSGNHRTGGVHRRRTGRRSADSLLFADARGPGPAEHRSRVRAHPHRRSI